MSDFRALVQAGALFLTSLNAARRFNHSDRMRVRCRPVAAGR